MWQTTEIIMGERDEHKKHVLGSSTRYARSQSVATQQQFLLFVLSCCSTTSTAVGPRRRELPATQIARSSSETDLTGRTAGKAHEDISRELRRGLHVQQRVFFHMKGDA